MTHIVTTVRWDDLMIGDTVLLQSVTNPNLVDAFPVSSIQLQGDDITINDGQVTSSRSNLVSVIRG